MLFLRFLGDPEVFSIKIFKILSARASGARECLLPFIDERCAQNQLIRESVRLAYLEKTW